MGHFNKSTGSSISVTQSYEYIKAILNRSLDDTAQPFISKQTFCNQDGSLDPVILDHLLDLEKRGLLKIIGPIQSNEDNPRFIKMLQYIDPVGTPRPHYINWDME